LTPLCQRLDEIVPVNVVQENALAAIASAYDVIHRAGVLDTQPTRHGGVVDLLAASVNSKAWPE
jgi:hypothetical protein